MVRTNNFPYFPEAPAQYDQRYLTQLTRSFSIFAQQIRNPGPLRATELQLTESTGNTPTGILTYNADADTLDLTHLNDVTQQIGFETFMRAVNDTGSTIPNGTVVGFAGADGDIEVSPYIANSAANELYLIGVTTFDMEDGAAGPVTVYGKVRGLNTTGSTVSETWALGDILYASPTTAGAFTKVRPTAPNVVIPVAAVLTVDAADGEILVRPTIPMGLGYGSFDSTTDQLLTATNTPTAITYDNTLSNNGVSLGTPASRVVVDQPGYYEVVVTLQLSSASSSSKNVYFWLRKNGVDVNESTRAITVDINAGFSPITLAYPISLLESDYVEIYWAADSTDVSLAAVTGLTFAPDSPSVLLDVNQTQL